MGHFCPSNIISPSPFGVIVISPSVSDEMIALPFTFILSTCNSVTALFVPAVTPSIVPAFISTEFEVLNANGSVIQPDPFQNFHKLAVVSRQKVPICLLDGADVPL